MAYRIANWSEFQHYGKETPKWIKLNKDWMTNFEFHQMSLAAQAGLMKLWLLAADSEWGEFDDNLSKISFRIFCTEAQTKEIINELLTNGFIENEPNPHEKQRCNKEKGKRNYTKKPISDARRKLNALNG